MDEATLAIVRSRVTALLAARPELLGARLGAEIKQIAPGVDLKVHFGGLRKFAESHLRDIAVWAGKRGPDDYYVATGQDTEPSWAPITPQSTRFWYQYTNPTSRARFAIDTSRDLIFVCEGPSELQIPDGLVDLPKLSATDYRRLSEAYLSELPESQRLQFATVLELDDFWPSWFGKIREHGLVPAWEQWRISRILDDFRKRLTEFGLSSQSVAAWAERLADSHGTARGRTPSPGLQTTSGHLTTGLRQESDSRALVKKAIDLLSEDDLRKLRLPVGAILDALRGRK